MSHILIGPAWVICFSYNLSLWPLELNVLTEVGVRGGDQFLRTMWLPKSKSKAFVKRIIHASDINIMLIMLVVIIYYLVICIGSNNLQVRYYFYP